MKHPSPFMRAAGVALLLLAMQTAVLAVPVVTLVLGEGSKLWLEGDSSIHRFEATAEVLQLDTEVAAPASTSPLDPGVLLHDAGAAGKITKLVLTIPIENLDSPTVGLSAQLQKTLKIKTQPNIVFTLDAYTVHQDAEDASKFIVTGKGKLSVAGVTKPLDLAMSGILADGHVAIVGEKRLLMTDYGIKPPTLMFGRIKVVDEIVIKWELKITLTTAERRS